MSDKHYNKVMAANTLAVDVTLSGMKLPETRENCVALAVLITNGAGAAPTSAPVGVWLCYFSFDDVEYFPLDDSDVTAQLTKIAAVGNMLVRRAAVIYNVPGRYLRAVYDAGSGGGAGTACDAWIGIS